MENTGNEKTMLTCPICNFASGLWVRLTNVSLYRCGRCKHCFTDVESVDQQESYGSDYYLETHRNWFQNPNTLLFSQIRSMILNHGANSVLDVGCGNGAFLKYMAEAGDGLELQGIDLSEIAKDKYIVFNHGDFLTFKFNDRFDAIVSLAVIEHLADVSAFVRRIHELLNADGLACVMTINEDGIMYRLANLLRRMGVISPFIRLYDAHHVNHFSQESLIRLLTKDGLFKVSRIINHNTLLAAIDIPGKNPIVRWLMKAGVFAIFLAGRVTQKTYLQTIGVTRVG